RRLIVDLAARRRLPAIYASTEFAGGLISYGVNYPETYRRAATYAHKIFKGARPADLPVEEPRTFELVINAKTARPGTQDSSDAAGQSGHGQRVADPGDATPVGGSRRSRSRLPLAIEAALRETASAAARDVSARPARQRGRPSLPMPAA